MFISINQTVFNITQIVSVVPEIHRYSSGRVSYGSAEPDLYDSYVSYKIHINTVNFRHDKPINRYEPDDDQYEYTFLMADNDEWSTTYNNICDALGVVGDIQDVRHNKVQVREYID